MATFEKEYKKLNQSQREAVDALEGPLLVVAGPGTGKTQLLSMRVANILRRTDVEPRQILCLTFTNKAALNMRERLLSLAGVEARDVIVSTFHSFAGELISRYPDRFWKGARLQIAPEAVQVAIVKSLLSSLPAKNPLSLKFSGQYTMLDDVTNAIGLAKEAGLTPEKLEALCQSNLAYIDLIEPKLVETLSKTISKKMIEEIQNMVESLPAQNIAGLVQPFTNLDTALKKRLAQAIEDDAGTGKNKHLSNLKAELIQIVDNKRAMHKERSRNEWWLAVANVYKRYRQAMHERGHYDYADMLVEVLAQLDQNPDLLQEVQDNYQYILIDEFQDCNAAQLRLAHLVADHPSSENRPNIMAVGDDDQSIFGFNGADIGTMLFFSENFSDTKTVVLNENYRSSQPILDLSQNVIDGANNRLVDQDKSLSKDLISKSTGPQKSKIEHRLYPTRDHQLSGVARDILKSFSSNTDVAVLARDHKSLRELSSLLLGLGVPINYEYQNNILDYDAIRQIITIVFTVHSLKNGDKQGLNYHLSQLLRHPMWGIDYETLWQTTIENYKDPDWLSSIKKSKDKKLNKIYDFLNILADDSLSQPLPQIIETIIGIRSAGKYTSPLRDYYTGGNKINEEYLRTLSGIRLLRELVNEFSDDKKASLSTFVDFIETINTSGKGINDESIFVTSDKAVKLYTVHKAKGLEFDTVYLINAVDNDWKPRSQRRLPPINLPLSRPGENSDDYVRLLYVALTRAKNNVIVSSYSEDASGREVSPTSLLHDALPASPIDAQKLEEPIIVLEESLSWPRLNVNDQKKLLKGYVENFAVNVTNLLNFLDITNGGPQYFLERNILRLPEQKTPALALGSAVHAALEKAQILTNENKFNLQSIFGEFNGALVREHLSTEDEKRVSGQGELILTKLFKDLSYELPAGSISELQINDVKIGEAVIGGKLDRVDKDEHSLKIIDYKTGSPLASLDTKSKSLAIKAWKHRTQLIFYALLARSQPSLSRYNNIEGQMVYLQAANKGQLTRAYSPSNEEIQRLEKLIQAVWRKVKLLDLPDINKYSKDIDGILKFEQDLIEGKI